MQRRTPVSHSFMILSLGVVPGLIVAAVLADGMVNPGESHSQAAIWAMLSAPPVVALLLGMFNDQGFVRSFLVAAGAFIMIGVWYALLFLPAAAICTVARGSACM